MRHLPLFILVILCAGAVCTSVFADPPPADGEYRTRARSERDPNVADGRPTAPMTLGDYLRTDRPYRRPLLEPAILGVSAFFTPPQWRPYGAATIDPASGIAWLGTLQPELKETTDAPEMWRLARALDTRIDVGVALDEAALEETLRVAGLSLLERARETNERLWSNTAFLVLRGYLRLFPDADPMMHLAFGNLLFAQKSKSPLASTYYARAYYAAPFGALSEVALRQWVRASAREVQVVRRQRRRIPTKREMNGLGGPTRRWAKQPRPYWSDCHPHGVFRKPPLPSRGIAHLLEGAALLVEHHSPRAIGPKTRFRVAKLHFRLREFEVAQTLVDSIVEQGLERLDPNLLDLVVDLALELAWLEGDGVAMGHYIARALEHPKLTSKRRTLLERVSADLDKGHLIPCSEVKRPIGL